LVAGRLRPGEAQRVLGGVGELRGRGAGPHAREREAGPGAAVLGVPGDRGLVLRLGPRPVVRLRELEGPRDVPLVRPRAGEADGPVNREPDRERDRADDEDAGVEAARPEALDGRRLSGREVGPAAGADDVVLAVAQPAE